MAGTTLSRMEDHDLYAILGRRRDASTQAVKAVYRQLARTFHPDANGDPEAVAHFRAITDAYVVLSDPELRALYDRQRRPRGKKRRGNVEETNLTIGLQLAGIDLGCLLGVSVQIRRRTLLDEEPEEIGVQPRLRLPPRRG